jgi:hypothetical protein
MTSWRGTVGAGSGEVLTPLISVEPDPVGHRLQVGALARHHDGTEMLMMRGLHASAAGA